MYLLVIVLLAIKKRVYLRLIFYYFIKCLSLKNGWGKFKKKRVGVLVVSVKELARN